LNTAENVATQAASLKASTLIYGTVCGPFVVIIIIHLSIYVLSHLLCALIEFGIEFVVRLPNHLLGQCLDLLFDQLLYNFDF
jgi:hypothetical protein